MRTTAFLTAGAFAGADFAGVVAVPVELDVDAPPAAGEWTVGADGLDGAEFVLDPVLPRPKLTGPAPLLGPDTWLLGMVGCCTGVDADGLCCSTVEAETGSGAGLDDA